MWPFRRKDQASEASKKYPTAEESNAALRQMMTSWKQAHVRPTWFPVVEEKPATNRGRSFFGGSPWLFENEQWPLCGSCERPAPFCLQLDSQELPEGAPYFGDGFLQFFYCGDCPANTWSTGGDPFDATQILRVIPHHNQGPATTPADTKSFPLHTIISWNPATDVPNIEDAEATAVTTDWRGRLTIKSVKYDIEIDPSWEHYHDDLREAITNEIGAPALGDKLGGWPHWIQEPRRPTCPACERKMTYLFQIDYEANLSIDLGDAGCGHLWQCTKHPEQMAFEWDCH